MKTVHIFYNPNSGKPENELAEKVKYYLIQNGFSEDKVQIITPKNADQAFQLAKKSS